MSILLQQHMTSKLRELAKIYGREKCAQIMNLSIASVNKFLSEKSKQSIRIEQFTTLYETLTPEQPTIQLCYKVGEFFKCTHFSAIYDNQQSFCEMIFSMKSQTLYLASIDKEICFVVSNRPYFESYPLNSSQLKQVGPYYLVDLLRSPIPSAWELGIEIQNLKDSFGVTRSKKTCLN